MTTQELIFNARNGDKNSLTQLLFNHKGIISAVVKRFLFENDQHEDLVQTIFIKVIKTLKQFNGSCLFSTWIYRISVNECMEFIRIKTRSKKYVVSEDVPISVFPDPSTPDALTSLADAEIHDSIQAALKELPLDQRTAFSLYYFGNYHGKEVAEALSITEANFYMKLKAARDSIKRFLMKQGWRL